MNLPKLRIPTIMNTEDLNDLAKDLELIKSEKIRRIAKENSESFNLWSNVIVGAMLVAITGSITYFGISNRLKIRKYYMGVFAKRGEDELAEVLTRSEKDLVNGINA